MKKHTILILACLISLSALPALADLSLSSGTVVGSTSEGSVRYKDLLGTNNNPDIYLGVDGLGTAGNRVQQTFYQTGGNWTSSNHFEFIYDNANDRLITNLWNSRATPYQLIWNNFASTMPHPGVDLNYLQIGMKSGTTNGTVSLTNLLLDGSALVGTVSSADATYRNWYLSGYNFNNGFTLSGDLVLTGTLLSNESSKVDITFGNASVVPAPGAALLATCGLGLIGWFKRRFA